MSANQCHGVANGLDASIDNDGNLNSGGRNSSSSEGPADDLRIKPDIMGNGTGLYSTYESADAVYSTISGTSMASPNVAGTLLLLQQHYKNVTNNFMKAATLKGLACHTADDAGNIGPDPVFGWGLLNAKKAAEKQAILTAMADAGLSPEDFVTNETPKTKKARKPVAPQYRIKDANGDLVQDGKLFVFTTRADTIMGVTFCAVAPEHPLAAHAALTRCLPKYSSRALPMTSWRSRWCR